MLILVADAPLSLLGAPEMLSVVFGGPSLSISYKEKK